MVGYFAGKMNPRKRISTARMQTGIINPINQTDHRLVHLGIINTPFDIRMTRMEQQTKYQNGVNQEPSLKTRANSNKLSEIKAVSGNKTP
jgi:hypothetical protein